MPRPPRPAASTAPRPGRTLVEMLAVLTLLGIAGAAVAPALPGAREERGAAPAARELAARLQRARALAAGRGEVATVVVDPASGRSWTMLGEDAPPVEDSTPLGRAGIAGTSVTIGAAGHRVRFVFLPSGAAWGDEVALRDAGGTFIVGVDRWTGAPHVLPR